MWWRGSALALKGTAGIRGLWTGQDPAMWGWGPPNSLPTEASRMQRWPAAAAFRRHGPLRCPARPQLINATGLRFIPKGDRDRGHDGPQSPNGWRHRCQNLSEIKPGCQFSLKSRLLTSSALGYAGYWRGGIFLEE